ncbi:alanine racemase [Aestuariimicrobium soli]|uniref:alanine racemase n=1 Tax=Aestuariimicrobium soli TaxID=2035834 RepID=UPI003EC0A14D
MSLTLHLDTAAWRAHLAEVAVSTPGLVPVAKGNGYGFGVARLADEATRLGANTPALDTLAVGIADEVAGVRQGWSGSIVVLTPWSAHDPVATALLDDPGVITTVGRLDDLRTIVREHPGARLLVEVRTPMQRFGLEPDELARAADLLGDVTFEGWTIHLPLAGDALAMGRDLSRRALAAAEAPVWLSHLSAAEYDTLNGELGVETRLRMGTKLWLGAPATRRVTARVLDLHPVSAGEKIGYWQHRALADGWVVVVSGGTANGVAMTAPSAGSSLRQRAQSLVLGGIDATGRALSPYSIGGRKRFFVEPPHMQSSLIFLPGAGAVAIGDEVPVEVRLTTAVVDRVIDSSDDSPNHEETL